MGNLRYLTVRKVAIAMKILLMKNRYIAPAKYFRLPEASPKPAVQSGGMSAVAMATPEITVPLSLRLISMMPAKPPKSAISTSYMVGLVRARSSVGFSSSRGDTRKYMLEARILMTTMISRFLKAVFMKAVSLVPRPYPMPNIGPIKGEMSMAPMMTGMELVLRPTDAITMAKARMYAFGPLNSMLLRIYCEALSVSMCSLRLTMLPIWSLRLPKKCFRLLSIRQFLNLRGKYTFFFAAMLLIEYFCWIY